MADNLTSGSQQTASQAIAAKSKNNDKVHACELTITFPNNRQAEQALQVLQVDAEPTTRVTKNFRLLTEETDDNSVVVVSMVVRFESKELKMLRVSVSSFYDYLQVVLKTMQQFDDVDEQKEEEDA